MVFSIDVGCRFWPASPTVNYPVIRYLDIHALRLRPAAPVVRGVE
jgi:hypothetical protein